MPTSRFNIRRKPRLNVLQSEQVEDVYMATMEVLERTGVRITHQRSLDLLLDAGARVDGDRVRIPDSLVKDALNRAPSRVVLGTRSGERTVKLERNRSWFGPSLDCLDYLEPATGERRKFRLEDCRTTASLLENLPNYQWGMTFGLASDVPPDLSDRLVLKEALTYSEKPMVFCCKDINSLKDIYEMALVIAGDEKQFLNAPSIVMLADPISPLMLTDDTLEKMIFCAEKRIPQICYGAPQAGSTGPATFAGSIVQGTAESLIGLVITQLVRPGAPFIYGAFATVMDMRTTIFSYGAPEMILMGAALAQMSQHFKLPYFGTAGCSDAKLPDSQAAAEATMSCMSAALSGANLIHDCGLLDHGCLASPAFMVLVHEVLDMLAPITRGIQVDDEHLAVDVIHDVGPGGHFMQEDHTAEHFREVWYSNMFDRSNYVSWLEHGGLRFEERLREQTLEQMEHHERMLPEEKRKELDRMAEHWE
ncbi:MAG: trimethylamine methyltransferase family protein [Desulfobacteraceae bacterium]|nr:trimethylamine methyltransferase family protein [Desulfobacteraceae bacterium]